MSFRGVGEAVTWDVLLWAFGFGGFVGVCAGIYLAYRFRHLLRPRRHLEPLDQSYRSYAAHLKGRIP